MKAEAHVSSTPDYYDRMFGHRNESYGDDENAAIEEESNENSTEDFVAHHTGLTIAHVTPHIGHLDETPYEHVHAGYDARFVDHSVVPHLEVPHGPHGVQGHLIDE